jgi:hypothetical protein
MTEIISLYKVFNPGKALPAAMKRGFAKAFDKFDTYQLSKYQSKDKETKLVDVVNLLHPKPTERNAEGLKRLVDGTLKAENTWEFELSQNPTNKAGVWLRLLSEGRLGYMALIRNLRNIVTQAPTATSILPAKLTDSVAITKSKIFPLTIYNAYREVGHTLLTIDRQCHNALVIALDVSLANIPKLAGKTLVVVDRSGSMDSGHNEYGSPSVTANMFAAALYKALDSDVILFGDRAQWCTQNPLNSVVTIAEGIGRIGLGGTRYDTWINLLLTSGKKYDRIIVLSDNEANGGTYNCAQLLRRYESEVGVRPFLYNIDLSARPTVQFPENRLTYMGGLSSRIFDQMEKLEMDKGSMVKIVEEYTFNG